MTKSSRSPLRDALLRVITQLPMCSATAGQLRTITGLDSNRIAFSLNRWVKDGYLVSVGSYGRRYFRHQADSITWAATPVDLPVDQALIDRLSIECCAELQSMTRSRINAAPKNSLPPRVSRPMTPEERKPPAAPRITRAPIGPGRFEVTGPVIGGFATLPLGQYLPEAGFSKYLEKTA